MKENNCMYFMYLCNYIYTYYTHNVHTYIHTIYNIQIHNVCNMHYIYTHTIDTYALHLHVCICIYAAHVFIHVFIHTYVNLEHATNYRKKSTVYLSYEYFFLKLNTHTSTHTHFFFQFYVILEA